MFGSIKRRKPKGKMKMKKTRKSIDEAIRHVSQVIEIVLESGLPHDDKMALYHGACNLKLDLKILQKEK